MTYPRALTARLLDYDADTVLATLTNALNISGMDELSGYGWAQCSLPYGDTQALELRRGRYIQIMSAGSVIFTFKIGGAPRYEQIKQGEEIEEVVTVRGQGWGSMFEEAVVLPDVAPYVPDYSYRWFSFASMTYDDSAFDDAIEQYEYHDFAEAATRGRVVGIEDTGADPDDPGDDELKLYVAPVGFPWPNAPKNGNGFAPTPTYEPTYWITANGSTEDDIGWHLFRHPGIVLAGDQQVSIFVTADNLFTLFLNGVPLLAEDTDMLMWDGWKELSLTLPAGTHIFAAAVQNVDVPSLPYNPGGFLFNVVAVSVYPGDVETSLTLNLASSASPMQSLFAADEWPGWSAGGIMLQLIAESVATGHLVAFDTVGSVSFSATTPTGGGTWDTEDTDTTLSTIPSIAFRLGITLGDVLRQLRDYGWAEWHFQGDALTLDMWTPGTVGTTPGVTFAHGTNIVSLERGETKPYANRLYVQWATSYSVVNDTVEQAAYGSVVSEWFSVDARTEEEALRYGRIELARRVQDERASTLMEIEPTSSADCPYEGFVVGDYVAQPQVDGTGTDTVQVHAIHFETDENGWAKWTLETGQRWRAPELEYAELLRNIGGKTVGSPLNHGVARE